MGGQYRNNIPFRSRVSIASTSIHGATIVVVAPLIDRSANPRITTRFLHDPSLEKYYIISLYNCITII